MSEAFLERLPDGRAVQRAFGQVIRHLREESGLSHLGLHQRLPLYSPGLLERMEGGLPDRSEGGAYEFSLLHVYVFAEAFGIVPEDMLMLTGRVLKGEPLPSARKLFDAGFAEGMKP